MQFLVLVDQTGSVAGCDVATTSGNPLLDGMGCQVIRKRARFMPALDLNGKPVRDSILSPPVMSTMK